MFTLVHGVFVIGFFGGGFKSQGGLLPSVGTLWQLVTQNHLEWPFLGLALSHGISFVHNYLWLGEYQQAKLQALMAQPYGRVVVLHLTILGGGFLMMALHSPRAGLVVLVLLKMAIDLAAHWRERTKFAAQISNEHSKLALLVGFILDAQQERGMNGDECMRCQCRRHRPAAVPGDPNCSSE